MKKILLINLIVCLIIFAILEFISYLLLKNNIKDFLNNFNKSSNEMNKPTLTLRYCPVKIYNQKKSVNLRNIKIGNSYKKPIIFFGCSYMNGATLEENQTLSYIISEKTGRSTVNRGIPAGSINNSIFDLRDDDFYKLLKSNNIKNPEYIVYMFINDHLKRISIPYLGYVTPSDKHVYEIVIRYKFRNGKLIENKPSKILLPFYTLYTTKAYYYLYANKFKKNSSEDNMINLFKAAKTITDEKFNKPKFVIIMYKDSRRLLMSDYMIKKLQDSGFIIFDAEKLAGHELVSDEWRSFDKEHPNEKAFQDVAKGLIKELKL